MCFCCDLMRRLKRYSMDPGGFTLIEIVLTIALVGIVAGVAAVIIMQGTSSYSTGRSRLEAHEQARFALERMSREVRQVRSRSAAPVDDIITMTAANLEFIDVNGTQIGFRLNGDIMERRENAGPWQVLATGITAPAGALFSYLDAAGAAGASQAALWSIRVELAAAKEQESLTLRTVVHPRNFK